MVVQHWVPDHVPPHTMAGGGHNHSGTEYQAPYSNVEGTDVQPVEHIVLYFNIHDGGHWLTNNVKYRYRHQKYTENFTIPRASSGRILTTIMINGSEAGTGSN
ncbi:hypothetical protein [Brenneria uluponensis]|uniref:hypothetical protein n=1 Tax=Brenneria uluponensis TaxID=3057057 RepID=UPI0028E3F38A|nr:hypothetical protein [Brenneria ulupoensis]